MVYMKSDHPVLSGYLLFYLKENVKVTSDVYFYFF